MKIVRVGGIPYSVSLISDCRTVSHEPGSSSMPWGEFSQRRQSIRIDGMACDERIARSLLHEIIHAIVAEYNVRELTNETGEDLETPIDQLATGLGEALESLGINLAEVARDKKRTR